MKNEPSEDYPLGGSVEPYDIEVERMEIEDSDLVGVCDCGNPVYCYMEENAAIFEVTGLCGVCATGEADCYFDEV